MFIDESGVFEKIEKDRPFPIIAGYLFDTKNTQLSEVNINRDLGDIVERYNLKGYEELHCSPLRNERKFDTITAIFDLLKAYKDYQIFYIKYIDDLKTSDVPRYTRMLYHLIHTIIFYSGLIENDITFDICVAERLNFQVTEDLIKGTIMAVQEQVEAKVKDIEISCEVVNIDKSKEHRLRLADFISNAIYRNDDSKDYNKDSYNKIKDKIMFDLEYSKLHLRFLEIADLFLREDYGKALPAYIIDEKLFSKESFYHKRLEELFNESCKNVNIWKSKYYHIRWMLNKSEELIRTSRVTGFKELSKGEKILSTIEKILDYINEEESTLKFLKFKTCHNFISLANHISNYDMWQKYMEKGNVLAEDLKREVIYYRDILDFKNACGNGNANYYLFEEAIKELEEARANMDVIIMAIGQITEQDEQLIKEPYLGKLLGSLGQNYAFQADICKSCGEIENSNLYYKKAKEFFEKALGHFSKDSHKAVQYSNLGHLALSQGDFDEAFRQIKLMAKTEDISPENLYKIAMGNNEKPDLYLLFLVFKAYNRKKDNEIDKKLIELASEDIVDLRKYTDHPSQLILRHLAEMRMRINSNDHAIVEDLKVSCNICEAKDECRPAINIMALKNYIILARYYFQIVDNKSMARNLKNACNICEKIMKHKPPLKNMLYEEDGILKGYFKDFYKSIKDSFHLKVDKITDNLFDRMMPEYPFNYE
jgi:hypothetical protein